MAVAKARIFSDALGMAVTVNVILPQEKELRPDVKTPVLWLLHGAFGTYSDWLRLTGIERYARKYDLAVVMPAAQNSGYADMAHGGRYYTYIAEELPKKMRLLFNLSDRREDNFIAGLSMGGKGSMMIGLANPDKYSVIGCLSAGIENVQGGFARGRRHELICGSQDVSGTYQDGFSSAKKILAQGMPMPRIYHACGTEDFLLESARATRDFFQGTPFEYTYVEHPGAHTWDFWDEHIRQFIEFLHLPET